MFRSRGPGGQSVNTTDSAVRITHLPTGIVVCCQNEKSQLQNREQAMRILRARLLAAAQEEADAEAGDARRSQVRTVDRSERIRTYNFAENRISDHRTGYKAYNLDQVLDGDLEPVIESCRRGRPGGAARLRSAQELTRSSRRRRCVAGRRRAGSAERRRRQPRGRRRDAAGARARHDAAGCRSSTTSPTTTAATYDALVARRAAASRCST